MRVFTILFSVVAGSSACTLGMPHPSEGSAMGYSMMAGPARVSQTKQIFRNYTPAQVAGTVFGVIGAELAPVAGLAAGAGGAITGAARVAAALTGASAGPSALVAPVSGIGEAILTNAASIGTAIGAAPSVATTGGVIGAVVGSKSSGGGTATGTSTSAPSPATSPVINGIGPIIEQPKPVIGGATTGSSSPSFSYTTGGSITYSDNGNTVTHDGVTYHPVSPQNFSFSW